MVQQSRIVLSLTAILAALACLMALPARAQVEPSIPTRRLISEAIDGRNFVTLAGNTRPEVNAENDRGPADNSLLLEHMQLTLQLPAEKRQELDRLVQDLQNPASPNYHKWLSADEFRRQFSPAPEDVDTISRWLEAQGFTINVAYPKSIDFSGTVGQVGAAFRTEIHNLEVNGVSHFANISDPQIPAALAPAVAGIVSLNDFRPHPAHTPRADYTVSGGDYLLVPGDLATVYNFNPLFSKGVSGQGQTIVVVEDSDVYSTSDWSTFRSALGLSGYTAGSFTQIHPAPPTGTNNCSDPGANGDDDEADIDVQWSSAAAPSAAIVLASCSGTSNFGGFIALQNLLNESGTPPAIVSISYGESEAQLGASSNSYISSLYEQAVAEGVSLFVSSGDEGAASSDAGNSYAWDGITVSGFASTIYNLAAGGTDFGDTYGGTTSTYWNSSNTSAYESAKSYIPEIPWNDSCASQLISAYLGYSTTYGSSGFCNSTTGKDYYLTVTAGSGGPSACATGVPSPSGVVSGTCAGYTKPSWQSVFGNPADGVRDIPDASLFASNGAWGHYYVVCYADTSHKGHNCTGAPNTWSGFGGTSFVAPILAGVQALINQVTGSSAGNPAPTYYSLAAAEYGSSGNSSCNSSLGNEAASTCVFYDVTQGDMDVNCRGTTNCYLPSGTNGALSQSSSAYEPAYGTSAGWDFATGIGTINVANLVNSWPKPLSFTSAASTTFLVGTQGTFTVTATGTPPPTLAESGTLPSSVTFNSATGVLSGTPAAGTGGVYDVTFAASNGVETNATQNFTLTVNQAPAITSAASTTFTAGSAGTFTATATGYPVPALSESGTLPNGVTFNTSTGVLSGTPSSSGTFNISFTASNGVGSNAVQSFTLSVNTSSGVGTFSNGYTYQRALTINASDVSGGSQTNFPVLISGTYSYLATAAHNGNVTNANGDDIIFTSDSAGQNLLNWEVESYNATTGAVDIWVRIPMLSSTANTVIYMWYGNSSVSTFQGGASGSVWDSNFKGVWHLPNGTTLSANDSTSNGNNAKSLNGTTATSGEIDGAASFNGSSNWIDVPTSATLGGYGQVSFSAWVNPANLANYGTVILKPVSTVAMDPYELWGLSVDPGGQIGFYVSSGGAGSRLLGTSNGSIPANTWSHLYVTYDGSTLRCYINGAADTATVSGSLTVGNGSGDVGIGQTQISGWNEYFDGTLDEIRFSSTTRSAGWITTEYNNQNSPSTFYSMGAAETSGGVSVPSITSLSPTSGTIGATVTITGTAFGSTQGSSTVTFSGTAATPTNWTATSITAAVPAGASTGNVVVTVGGVASNGINFTVIAGGASYSYERTVTINSAEVVGTQTNFPALIAGTYSYLATVANGGNVTSANGYDIIFTSDSAGQNLLNWEAESYNATTGAVDIWVRIPTLSSTANTVIYVWYGNSSVSTFQGGASGSVWDSNFKGVWHLPNGTTLTANDSTSNGNNAKSLNGTTAASGQIDGAASFNGSSSWIDVPTSPTLGGYGQVSFSAWVNPANLANYGTVILKPVSTAAVDPYELWGLSVDPGGQIGFDVSSGAAGSRLLGTSNVSIPANTWSHLYVSYDGSTLRCYINGVADTATVAGSLTVGDGSEDVGIGQTQIIGWNEYFDGMLDEVRFSSTARSAGWIATEYNNQSIPATFYTIGAAQ